MSSSPSAPSVSTAISELQKYSACDIADALLKLEPKNTPTSHRAGFLADISPLVPAARSQKIIAPAYTVLFHSKLEPGSNSDIPSNIPKGAQWSDLVAADTIVLVQQPPRQHCASVGGHHAARIARLGAKGLLVSGRVRDVADMGELGLGVWARGTSAVGAGAEAKPQAVQVPVDIGGVEVSPGDMLFLDPAEGAVRIPKDLIEQVLEFLPGHSKQEDAVKGMIAEGKSVQEAFAKGRL